MHNEVVEFVSKIKKFYPKSFENVKVLDIGSLDINGNNRMFFENSQYTGVDLAPGKNVDLVGKAFELTLPDNSFDTIISTECFEHDFGYEKSVMNAIRMLKLGGMLIFSCATTGRPEHGTTRTSPNDNPLRPDIWNDYYKNLTEDDFCQIEGFIESFTVHSFMVNTNHCDLYFYGFKA